MAAELSELEPRYSATQTPVTSCASDENPEAPTLPAPKASSLSDAEAASEPPAARTL